MKTIRTHYIVRVAQGHLESWKPGGCAGRTLLLQSWLVLALSASVLAARASDPVGIYAVVQKVVFEPSDSSPERVEIRGAFALAKGADDHYERARRGYLYFKLNPEKATECRNEWADLKKMAGTGEFVAFGSRHGTLGRLRAPEEPVKDPDVYPIAWGVSKVRRSDYGPIKELAALVGSPSPAVPKSETPDSRVTAEGFPAGTYISCSGNKPAKGQDAAKHESRFKLEPGQYVLSGGPRPTDPILVDDDLVVAVGDRPVFVDDDHCRSDETRSEWHRTYDGSPLILSLHDAGKIRVQAIDTAESEAVLGPLFLFRYDGASKKVTDRVEEASQPPLPRTFFDKEFDVT